MSCFASWKLSKNGLYIAQPLHTDTDGKMVGKKGVV